MLRSEIEEEIYDTCNVPDYHRTRSRGLGSRGLYHLIRELRDRGIYEDMVFRSRCQWSRRKLTINLPGLDEERDHTKKFTKDELKVILEALNPPHDRNTWESVFSSWPQAPA